MILVNEQNQAIGEMDKMRAHTEGHLHRAFSVFIFNSKGNMLLQKRAESKYHGGSLWTNACCSHPYPGEEITHAAERRLEEELGFSTHLEEIFSFIYRSIVENGLIEHEFDHVFAGEYEGTLNLNKDEVADYRYISMEDLQLELEHYPARFTSWFKIAFPDIKRWWQRRYEANETVI